VTNRPVRLGALSALLLLVSAPTASALDVLSVPPVGVGRGGYWTQTTDTLWKLDTAVQIVYSYLHRPITIRRGGGEADLDVVGRGQVLTFSAGIGLIDRLELDVAMPLHIDRKIDPAFESELSGTSPGDLYLALKYQALRRSQSGFGLTVTPFVMFGTGNADKLAGSGNQNFGLVIAADRDVSILTFAANAGFTRRADSGFLTDHFDEKLQSSFDWGALVSVRPIKDWLELYVETNGLVEVEGDHGVNALVLGGVKSRLGPLDFTAGYGKGLTNDLPLPSHMFYFGVGYYRWPEADRRFDGEAPK